MSKSESKKTPLIALIADDETERNSYLEQIRSFKADVHPFQSIADLKQNAGTTRYHGVAIDFKTVLKSSGEEKLFLVELEDVFPVLRLGLKGERERMASGIDGLQGAGDLNLFLTKSCREFLGRGIRKERRIRRHLNVRYCENRDFSKSKVIRSATADISSNGLFVIAVKKREIFSTVWVEIKEMATPGPIEASICWTRPWGVDSWRLPGFGIQFTKLNEDQKQEMARFLFEDSPESFE